MKADRFVRTIARSTDCAKVRAMKINWTLVTTLTLSIVIGGAILAWLFRVWKKLETKAESATPQLPPGPVGFKLLPACALPDRG
jgi:hypothetical protein